MMSRTAKTCTWIWIASLMVATIGVSGRQIYCYCVGQTSFEFFAGDDNGIEDACCLKEEKKAEDSCCKVMDHQSDPNCCTSKTTKVFHLKPDFTTQEADGNHFSDLESPVYHPPFTEFLQVWPKQICGIQQLSKPPPVSGRMICVRHNIFRC
ncbi:MAG: hypothetical protein R3A50_12390 [Saprospiraceae bacterium]